MNYEPVQLYLQEYLNMVHFFQTTFLTNLGEIKALTGYRSGDYPKPRASSSYNNLLKMLIYHEIQYNLISKAAICLLDNTIVNFFGPFLPKNKSTKGLMNLFRKEELPNRISLEGYSIPDNELENARRNLLQIMSVDEKFNLIYVPEMIRQNYFVIFRQR